MWLDRESTKLFEKNFADAAADQQKQILDRIAWPERAAKEDHAWVQFFYEFRDLTVSGFFSSKMGVAICLISETQPSPNGKAAIQKCGRSSKSG